MYIASMTYGYRSSRGREIEGILTREYGQNDVMVEVMYDMLLEAARTVKRPMMNIILLKFDLKLATTQAKSSPNP